ncbi:uncharacterized protein LOC110640873 [Hevea brasiliensis]|uniref:uncharacterized protein LOC110640873 n=1 Tax=Hevea brasiliensis TaxID=3981 RepID=UPI0025D22076|nr:uncharacterized protein LOC110640873 [Hevea brasiliensis]
MSPLLVCLLICFFMHACNARHIGLSAKETRKQDFAKDAHKVNLCETSVSSEMIPSIPEEFEAKEREKVGKIDRRTIHENFLGAGTYPKNVEALFKEEEGTKKAPSGAGHELIVSSQSHLQQIIKIEGSAPSDTKKALELSENGIVEDAVVMDYAQPHRKPPIHNEKP